MLSEKLLKSYTNMKLWNSAMPMFYQLCFCTNHLRLEIHTFWSLGHDFDKSGALDLLSDTSCVGVVPHCRHTVTTPTTVPNQAMLKQMFSPIKLERLSAHHKEFTSCFVV